MDDKTKKKLNYLRSLKADADIDLYVPDFKATLRNYQKHAVYYMAYTKGCILADPCGAGKTIMTLALASLLESKYPGSRFLVLTTSSLVYQWKSEIEKFTELTNIVVRGTKKKRFDKEQQAKALNITVTNYEVVRAEPQRFNQEYDAIFYDEATAFKSLTSKLREAIVQVAARSKRNYPLTATPLENNLDELFSIISVVDPNILGDYESFRNNYYVVTIQKVRRKGKRGLGGGGHPGAAGFQCDELPFVI